MAMSNGGYSAVYEVNMNKINDSVIIELSGKESVTAHSHCCASLDKRKKNE